MEKEKENKKFYMMSLGCPKNRVDSEIMAAHLIENNIEVVPTKEEADYLMVNTCGFIEDAKKESLDTIMEFANHKKESDIDF